MKYLHKQMSMIILLLNTKFVATMILFAELMMITAPYSPTVCLWRLVSCILDGMVAIEGDNEEGKVAVGRLYVVFRPSFFYYSHLTKDTKVLYIFVTDMKTSFIINNNGIKT